MPRKNSKARVQPGKSTMISAAARGGISDATEKLSRKSEDPTREHSALPCGKDDATTLGPDIISDNSDSLKSPS